MTRERLALHAAEHFEAAARARGRTRQRLAPFGVAQATRIFSGENAINGLVLREQLEFEDRRLADDPFGSLRVGFAGELDEDRVTPAALNDRLREAELVDAVTHGLE